MNGVQLTIPLMQQLGDVALAEKVIDIDYYRLTDIDKLAGWRRVNSGMYRNVFRGPDEFVYKVSSDFDMQVNEVRIFHGHALEPWCPPASLHLVKSRGHTHAVVVMPYYTVGYRYRDEMIIRQISEIERTARITDLGNTNVAKVNDQVVVIDAGNYMFGAVPSDDLLLCNVNCPCRVAHSVPHSER
jgi:hypothetical protein